MKGRRQVHFPETGHVACTVYDRYALRPGDAFRGPAVVEEREATVVVGPDAGFRIDQHLNLVMDIDRPAASAGGIEEG